MVLGKIFCSKIRVIEWQVNCDFKLNGNIDIWKVYVPNVIGRADEYMSFLSSDELHKSQTFINDIDRNSYIVKRIYLRKVLSGYLKIPPSNVVFEYSEHNKPYLSISDHIEFNISKVDDYLIIGIANRWSLGVDIKVMDEKVDLYHMIYRTMSKEEISSILNNDFPREVFYRMWTRKNALLKGLGVGRSESMREISCCEGLNLVPLEILSFTTAWVVRSFIMENKYSVSFAHDAAIRVVRFYEIGE